MHKVAFILLIIGGLNWGLTAVMPSWDLAMYLGDMVARIVYALVGISAIVEVVGHKKVCRNCSAGGVQM